LFSSELETEDKLFVKTKDLQ